MVFLGLLLALAVTLGLAILGSVWLILRATLWLVLLPLRLVFAIIALPLLLLKVLIFSIVAVVFLALIAAGGALVMAGLVGFLLAVVLPLVPILLVGTVVWLVVKMVRRPALS